MTPALAEALHSRPLRFVVTGAAAAALFVVLASLLAGAGMAPVIASPLAYLVAFAFAYLAQRAWTFGAEQAHAVAFPRYLALQLGCATLSGAVSHVAAHWYGAAPLAMSVIAVIVTSAVSYVLSSRWVFSRGNA